jgi:hypothetical protein
MYFRLSLVAALLWTCAETSALQYGDFSYSVDDNAVMLIACNMSGYGEAIAAGLE